METLRATKSNVTKIDRLRSHWDALLAESLRRGFHGTVRLELIVSDGTIQQINRSVERIEK